MDANKAVRHELGKTANNVSVVTHRVRKSMDWTIAAGSQSVCSFWRSPFLERSCEQKWQLGLGKDGDDGVPATARGINACAKIRRGRKWNVKSKTS